MPQQHDPHAETVIEIKGPNARYAEEAFRNAFPPERDHLLALIPQIRNQMESWEIHHEEPEDPPQYLRLTRRQADDLAELLETIAHQQRSAWEVSDVAFQIRQQLQTHQPDDPDRRTLHGRPYGWTQPAHTEDRPDLLVTVPNPSEIHHPARLHKALVGQNQDGGAIFGWNYPKSNGNASARPRAPGRRNSPSTRCGSSPTAA